MIEPIILPITLYSGDDFDLKLNWRVRCGATYDLGGYDARMTFWASQADITADRSGAIYTLNAPQVSGEGIVLAATSPNIWVHLLSANLDFSTEPHWQILELRTPVGADPMVDGVWFRLAEGKVTYVP